MTIFYFAVFIMLAYYYFPYFVIIGILVFLYTYIGNKLLRKLYPGLPADIHNFVQMYIPDSSWATFGFIPKEDIKTFNMILRSKKVYLPFWKVRSLVNNELDNEIIKKFENELFSINPTLQQNMKKKMKNKLKEKLLVDAYVSIFDDLKYTTMLYKISARYRVLTTPSRLEKKIQAEIKKVSNQRKMKVMYDAMTNTNETTIDHVNNLEGIEKEVIRD